ncbi:hypothetical protein KPL71_022033 [Citrus sinensis]|uniref:Uncharacterized protein n=1 Tax=Citrus sinensis TaxID=2711 RepID=A0ACB8JKZ7_CITSI|nr:hypothetical protein KPL71_022033 [Citrus sinensis]
MDRSWITCDRLSVEYRSGVADFLDFAILNAENRMSIRCPCTFCCNMEFHTPQQVKDHLFEKGFLPRYIVWTWHGETDSKSTFTNCEDHSHSQRFRCHDYSNIIDMVEDAYEHCDRDPSSFKDMLEDAEKPLYPGAKHSKLSSLMRLYNVKGNYGWSDTGFSALLEVLADILPNNNTLPMSMYEVKKTMKVLGLEYEKIHACPNDCILYRNEFADLAECPNCGASRLKRLFQSPQTAQNLTWHANKRIRDGKLRHPADSPAWQLIDNKWPKFAQEPRNLRLALSTDGVNPHSTLSTTYSYWPVILITYNLPPWLCMKRKFLMLSLLISGPKQPGNDLDVYLAPLIEDLKTLWDVDPNTLDQLQEELVITLCLLQQYFPPSFFDIMIHLTVHLVEQVRLCGPVYLRWMYPFERQMKTLKDYVRNRYRPEGCIVESYIAEEALAFCAVYLSNCDVIGLPTGFPTDLSIEKPLGGANIKVVDDPLLAQAHRCVLMNTPEIQIYIEEHMHYLASRNPYKAKTNLWLQNEHIRTFSGWLQAKVAHDKANNVPIDEIVCWLANKPRSSVVTFSGYEINGFNFTTRDRDCNRVTQNSGVRVVANTLQISSSKDKSPHFGDMTFYGVIDEIWQLDYLMEMADDVEFTLPELDGRPRRRKQTKKKGLQKQEVSHEAAIEYNSYGVPVGKGRNDLRSYIGVIVRETISILLDDWRRVPLEMKETLWVHFQKKFKLSLKCKSQVLKWMGVASRNFRCELATEFVLPNKDDRKSLRLPPIEYPSIKKEDWKLFVDKVLSEQFQEKSKKAKDKRAKNVYNHRLGNTGYGGMLYRKVSVKKESGVSEREIDRSEAWLMARADRDGKYASDNELKSHVEQGTFQSQGSHDILGEALQKQPNGSRVQGVGQFVTPSMYFHVPDATELARERKMYQESFQFMSAQLERMNARLNAYSNTEVGSSNFPKSKTSTGVQIDNDQQSPETLGKRKFSCHDKVPNKEPPVIRPAEVAKKEPRVIIPAEVAKKEPRVIRPAEIAKKEPRVIRPAAKDLNVRVKNTRAAARSRKNDMSEYMNMFTMFIENSLPRLIRIRHDTSTFGEIWETHLDKMICAEIIEFKEVSNCIINIWIKHLYEEMESNGSTKPVQFGLFEKLYPRVSFKDRTQYISKLLGLAELGQVIVFPYNPGAHWVLLAIDMVRRTTYYLDPLEGSPDEELMQIVNQGIRIHQSLNSDTKANVQWIPVKPSSFECGYYVMKYMQDIITNVNVLKNNRDVASRYLLRLGQGEQELATDIDFSREGQVNAMLVRRLELLSEVERLARSLRLTEDVIKLTFIKDCFPFKEFFSNTPQSVFTGRSFEEVIRAAKGYFHHFENMFQEIEERRAFELLKSTTDQANYLMTKQAKIVAITCTYAALKRKDFLRLDFKYDNLLMEESAQMLEIETCCSRDRRMAMNILNAAY